MKVVCKVIINESRGELFFDFFNSRFGMVLGRPDVRVHEFRVFFIIILSRIYFRLFKQANYALNI